MELRKSTKKPKPLIQVVNPELRDKFCFKISSYFIPEKQLLTGVNLHHQPGVILNRQKGVNPASGTGYAPESLSKFLLKRGQNAPEYPPASPVDNYPQD